MATRKTFAQVPIRNRGDNQCPHHNTEVMLACIDCGRELVCSQCITTKHKRHEFENISQFAEKKKNNIKEYIKIVEKSKLPSITNNLQSVDQQVTENTNHFKNLEKEIKSRGEKMKEEIDRITKEMIQKCKEILRQNSELLCKYKEDLQYLYTQLSQTVEECKDTLRADNNILIIDVEKDTQQEFKPPNPPKYTTVTFTAGPKSSKHLQDDFGFVKQYRSNDSTVQSEFKYTYTNDIRSVKKSTSDSVWLSFCDEKYISRVTTQGEVKQRVELGSDVWDISVSPVTGNLWLCCRDRAVYEISSNKPTKRFYTGYFSWYLCMTPDNNVVVSNNDHNVTVYSTTGQVLHSTQGSGSVVSPHHVTVCTSTGDIAVCDRDLSSCGGKGKPHVSLFNSKLDLKYQYYGPPASVMKSDFKPTDIVYDTKGHLLIIDSNNKCIQLVSGEGQFLTVVHTDTLQPRTLTLIQDGLLCVGLDDKKVKVIRYRVSYVLYKAGQWSDTECEMYCI